MANAIHYIGVGQFEEIHRCHFAMTEGKLPTDGVVLIHASEKDPAPAKFYDRIKEALEEADIPVRSETFGQYSILDEGFEEIYQYAYFQLLNELQAGNEVYINVSSGPVYLGYAFIYGTYTLLIEATNSIPGDESTIHLEPAEVRNNIHIYETIGSSYLPDILNALYDFSRLLASLETTNDRQEELLNDLHQKGLYHQEFLQLLGSMSDASGDKQPKWREVATHIDDLSPNRTTSEATFEDSITDLEKGLEQVFTGLQNVSEGLETLSDPQLRNDTISARNLTDLPHHKEVISLLKQVKELSTIDGERTEKIDVIQILTHESESMLDILDELEFRQQDTQRLIEKHEITANLGDEIWEYGISAGFDHLKLPIPPLASLRDLETAIIITLYSMDSADSITELIDALIQMTRLVTRNEGDDLEEGVQIDEVLAAQEMLSNDDNESSSNRQDQIDSLRSKIQYNLAQLEKKGFIQKKKIGRSNEIHLTEAGMLWIYTKILNQDSNNGEYSINNIKKYYTEIKDDIE